MKNKIVNARSMRIIFKTCLIFVLIIKIIKIIKNIKQKDFEVGIQQSNDDWMKKKLRKWLFDCNLKIFNYKIYDEST